MKKALVKIAPPFDDALKKRISDGFDKKLGAHEYEFLSDDGIGGGFIAYIDGRVYDASVRSRLSEIKKNMVK